MNAGHYKLWNGHLMEVCLSSFFLFGSFYMLLPVLVPYFSVRLDIGFPVMGLALLLFPLGMFLIGPFQGYLIDAYKRKLVCETAYCCLALIIVAYLFVENVTQLLFLFFSHGAAFGVASTLGITLGIDVTSAHRRSDGNVSLAWFSRLGALAGLLGGAFLYAHYPPNFTFWGAVFLLVLALFLMSMVYVPFRAPMNVKLLTFDRFWLPRAWLPAINLMMAAFALGLILYSHYLENGASLDFCSLALLLVLGVGFLTPHILYIFIKLSQHCQRGTANSTHFLSWESGLIMGVVAACLCKESECGFTPYELAGGVMLLTILLFGLVTFRYYKKRKLRA